MISPSARFPLRLSQPVKRESLTSVEMDWMMPLVLKIAKPIALALVLAFSWVVILAVVLMG